MYIDINDPLALYYQLFNIIRERILNGELKERQTIPSERELKQMYGVSRATVRQAMELLIEKGFLYRIHGKGTFVSPRRIIEAREFSLLGFKQNTRKRGLNPGEKIVSLEKILPDDDLYQELELERSDQKVQKLVRLFYSDDKLISLNTSYLNLPEDESITREELIKTGSLYSLLKQRFNFVPTDVCGQMQAVLAGEEEAEILDVAVGFPLIRMHYTVYNLYRQIMEIVDVLERGDYSIQYSDRLG